MKYFQIQVEPASYLIVVNQDLHMCGCTMAGFLIATLYSQIKVVYPSDKDKLILSIFMVLRAWTKSARAFTPKKVEEYSDLGKL